MQKNKVAWRACGSPCPGVWPTSKGMHAELWASWREVGKRKQIRPPGSRILSPLVSYLVVLESVTEFCVHPPPAGIVSCPRYVCVLSPVTGEGPGCKHSGRVVLLRQTGSTRGQETGLRQGKVSMGWRLHGEVGLGPGVAGRKHSNPRVGTA